MVMKREGLCGGMNAKVIGSGIETLVLAHGYGADQSVWDKVVPLLASHYRVVVFDWCFSGSVEDPSLYNLNRHTSYDAFADDLISLIEEMKLSCTVFVGHSMSGMIGCIVSLKRPDLFSKLLLVGASPRLINTQDYEGGFKMEEIEQMLDNIESNYDVWASTFASLVVDESDPLSVQKFANSLQRMGPRVALPMAKTVFLADHRDILDKVVVPCHVIQTRNDVVVPLSVVNYMQEKIKGETKLHIVDTNGHFPQLTAHLQFVEIINAILRS